MFMRFVPLVMIVVLLGCGGSDKNAPQNTNSQTASSSSADTTKVSQQDLDTARATFHIRPDLQIEAKGYDVSKVTETDTMTFFKFVANTDKIKNVFTADIDTTKFHPGHMLLDHPRLGWWDVIEKEFDGGTAEVNGSRISIGYKDNKDGTLTVYVMR